MPPSKNISFDELSKYFHLPINQVAKEMGVCATILKKICRRNGIPRWPHRKVRHQHVEHIFFEWVHSNSWLASVLPNKQIKSLDKMIGNLNMNLAKNPEERQEISREIELLESKKLEIMRNPVILGKRTLHLFVMRILRRRKKI